jgi:cyclic pyranopterin phosphate synthase
MNTAMALFSRGYSISLPTSLVVRLSPPPSRRSPPRCCHERLTTSRSSFSSFVPSSSSLLENDDDAQEARPRLQALRQQLALEQDDDVLQTFKNLNYTKRNNNNNNVTTSDHTRKTKEPSSVFDILEQLQDTPPISSPNILQDSFGRQHDYLRISLVERCNLRCQYCMPPDGVPLQPSDDLLLSREEIYTLTALFSKHGVTKVRLTGGEPLLRRDLVEIVSDLAQTLGIPHVGMTTNGVTLKHKLPSLVHAGLTHVNISLDTLRPNVFEILTRRRQGYLTQVLSSIHCACELLPLRQRVKINVVVMKGINDDELEDFCYLTKQLPLDVRFIEFMPFHDNGWNQGKFVSYRQMQTKLQHLHLQRIPDGPNDTTKWWKLPQDHALGRIGFITSMSDHFCGTCNRLRLTADGKLKACLFGSSEVSLRDALRSGYSTESIEKLIHYAVQRKTFALGGHGSALGIAKANDNRPMTLIGG